MLQEQKEKTISMSLLDAKNMYYIGIYKKKTHINIKYRINNR